MPRRLLMSDIRTRCQRRSDREGDLSIQTLEWNALTSEQYGELYSIVGQTGLRYFETVATYTTAGLSYVAEPTDHYETVNVRRVMSDGSRYQLTEAMERDTAWLTGRTGDATHYTLVDDRLYLFPTPPVGQVYEMLYIPQPPDLTNYADTDVVDVVTPDGEAFLIWGVVVKALAKSEADVTLAVAEREAARVRFTEEVTLRALNTPRRRVLVDWGFDDRVDEGDWRFGR